MALLSFAMRSSDLFPLVSSSRVDLRRPTNVTLLQLDRRDDDDGAAAAAAFPYCLISADSGRRNKYAANGGNDGIAFSTLRNVMFVA